jgi:two-component system, NarL family, nitrate/nitrite response regulator NarL
VTTVARVLLADDHAPTRADIRDALEADERFLVVAEAADAAGAVSRAMRVRPDVCVLDLNMPGSGVAAAWEIASRLPATKVVMLTVSDDDEHIRSALRAGAAGYLLKDMNPERLPHALADVLAGEVAIPRRLVTRLVEDYRDGGRRRRLLADDVRAQLTSREWEVLDLLRRGLSTREIASRLVVSNATVRSHVAALLRKLGVEDRDAAVRMFEER